MEVLLVDTMAGLRNGYRDIISLLFADLDVVTTSGHNNGGLLDHEYNSVKSVIGRLSSTIYSCFSFPLGWKEFGTFLTLSS